MSTPPAASGAAPADIRELLEACSRWHNGSDWRFHPNDERVAAWHLHRKALDAALASREASPAATTETPQELERALGQAIDERDERDEVIDALCDAVLGKDRTEWSSMYGFRDAVNEVEEHMAALASPQVAPESDARDAALWRAHAAKLDALMTYCPTCCQGFTALPELTRDQVIFECGKTAGRVAAPVQVAPGLSVKQEPKYTVNGHAIVNRASGEAIPADEPAFVFRARDVHAREALEAYACVLTPGAHRDAVVARVADFAQFAFAHPDRMKEPDTAAAPTQTGAAADDARDAAEVMTDEEIADEVVQRVCEYDDRTSPEDWPDALLITGEELKAEVLRALEDRRASSTPAAKPAEEQGS